MARTIAVISLFCTLTACAVFQRPDRETRLSEGGQAYCVAHRAKDHKRMKSIAHLHRLNPEPWDKFCSEMEQMDYSEALDIAKDRKLGTWALRKAGIAYASRSIEDDSVFTAYMTIKDIGMNEGERKAFGETMHAFMIGKGECLNTLEIAKTFDLSERLMKKSLECIERKHGMLAPLVYACINHLPEELIEPYRQNFMEDLAKWHGQTLRQGDFEDALIRCEWDRGALENQYAFLLKSGNLKLSTYVLGKLGETYWSKDRKNAEARRLFDQAVAVPNAEQAGRILKSFPDAIELVGKNRLLDLYLSEMQCPEALAFAHKEGLSDATIDSVFTAPRCIGSEFDNFPWILPYEKPEIWKKYFDLALKHKRFKLARSLVDNAKSSKNVGGQDIYKLLIDAALADHAHVLLFELDPPPEEDVAKYRNRIFEHALDHGDEWTAAAFAEKYHPHPESVIERAYLRSMERGESVQAVQIAQKYGDPQRLADRGRLAFETAMLAEKPKDAQYILRISKVEDPEKHQRAAIMVFRQKREAERKAAREKKRRERKKREASGEWSPKRD